MSEQEEQKKSQLEPSEEPTAAPDVPARSQAASLSLQPLDSLRGMSLHDTIFRAAGIDLKKKAKILTQSVKKLQNLMEAKAPQRLVVNDGLHSSKVVEFVDEDGALQARAATELAKIVGAYPSRSSGTGDGKVQVGKMVIVFADMSPSKPVASGTIIDGEVIPPSS